MFVITIKISTCIAVLKFLFCTSAILHRDGPTIYANEKLVKLTYITLARLNYVCKKLNPGCGIKNSFPKSHTDYVSGPYGRQHFLRRIGSVSLRAKNLLMRPIYGEERTSRHPQEDQSINSFQIIPPWANRLMNECACVFSQFYLEILYMHTHTHARARAHTHTHKHTQTQTHTHTFLYLYHTLKLACVCVCVCACVRVCVCVCTCVLSSCVRAQTYHTYSTHAN